MNAGKSQVAAGESAQQRDYVDLLVPNDLQDNPVAIAAFLTRSFETNDLQHIVAALAVVITAQNVLALAEPSDCVRHADEQRFQVGQRLIIQPLVSAYCNQVSAFVIRAEHHYAADTGRSYIASKENFR